MAEGDATSGVVEIARLGAQGDGVAETPRGPVYVPQGLPGETWRLVAGAGPELLVASKERVTPPCPHFGTCGGCVAQHMGDDLYARWKHGIVAQAFAHRGIDVTVQPLYRIGTHSRRRATLGVARTRDGIALGFREEGQHRLVDLATCLILDPAIVAALPELRALAAAVLPRDGPGGRIVVTRIDDGLDAGFDAVRKDLGADALQDIAQQARRAGIVRLVLGGDVVMCEAPPRLTLAGAIVDPPPGIFLQAVPEAEAVMTGLITAAMPRAKSVADLFCGLGTFTFALARKARVTAIDGEKRAISALQAAAKATQGLKPIDSRVRDLFREPLTQRELDAFDAVVFDPPRAGAQAQCERLAKSKVATVVAASCNPATLARDARILIDGGYRLVSVTPVDQFVYAPHVEAVAVFRR
jgi:23S rRNA (uracil1939-C5)-methyltransferase